MSRYSIEGSTLTALGDAIRGKVGETKEKLVPLEPIRVVFDEATDGLESFDFANPWYDKKIYYPEVEGATAYKLVYSYKEGATADFITLHFREGGTSRGSFELVEGENLEAIWNRPSAGSLTIQIIYSLYATGGNRGNTTYLDLTIYPINAAGEIIDTQVSRVFNSMTPANMVEAIEMMEEGVQLPEAALKLTGSCQYRFYGGGWDWFIQLFGKDITAENILVASNMFYGSQLEKIPFTLNFSSASNTPSMTSMFASMTKLKEAPKIAFPTKLKIPTSKSGFFDFDKMFDGCHLLREIPADYFDNMVEDGYWDARITLKADGESNGFNNCYSLRNVSPNLYKALRSAGTAYYYSCCYYLHQNNYALDEVVELPVEPGPYTTNAFNNTFHNCFRLARVKFETNEDGTPKTANWKSQTITLGGTTNGCVGYAYNATHKNNILNYNSGITADKEVKDDATYAALKNDPDWFTVGESYSRYNKTSAIETINTLPDVSASGGTNTIKFRGVAGGKTDGGAINTMTEAEIAVAAAKGWTVSFT